MVSHNDADRRLDQSEEWSSPWLAFFPRDAVHVRDGRTFQPGGTARTRRPWPSTLAGAVGAAFGHEMEAVRGPLPVMHDVVSGSWNLRFPLPADLALCATGAKRWWRLRPLQDGAVTDIESGGLRLLAAKRAGPFEADRWCSGNWLAHYLADRHPDPITKGVEHGPFIGEQRIGIAREGRAVKEGHLYSAEFLRLSERPETRWAFAAQCALPPGTGEPRGPVRFGGVGRMADVEKFAPEQSWPGPLTEYPEGKVLVYLATPGIWRIRTPEGSWRTSWRPALPPQARLYAAAVPEREVVSTARPLPDGRAEEVRLRWAVPAGTVYLLRFSGEDPAETARVWAHSAHGRALGAEPGNKDETGRRLATAGFGVILTGTW